MRRATWLGVLLLTVGCQTKLNFDRTLRVDNGAVHNLEIDAPRYNQTMAVSIHTDAPIRVDVYLKQNADAVEKDLTLKQKSDKTLGSWTGDKTGTLEVSVPAGQTPVVR